MSGERYPLHGRCGAAPRSSGRRYDYCGGALVPPEVAGLSSTEGALFCTSPECPMRLADRVCVVEASVEDVEQAREAALVDGTWPGDREDALPAPLSMREAYRQLPPKALRLMASLARGYA